MKIPSLGRYSTVALLLVPVLLAVVLFAAVKRGSGPRDLRSALASARNAVPMGTEASLTYDDDSDYVVVSVTGAGLDGDSVSLASSARRVAEAVFGSQREGTFAEVGVLIWSGKGGRARPNFALVAWLSFMSLRSGIRMRRHVKKVGRLVAYEEWPDVAKAEFRRMLRFMAANSALILVLLLLQIWDRVKD